ncbi:uncharacterized protein LOC115095801 isoform X1 [Rhinatrema bivittatum]|uniref:uncharacterized protein LOC115095801 isoform X1 n=1 Tax=Rhinatrema bivittatum TaxID=194408 RepID=UPI00112D637A|nr:uncharacterized protein LOC115095801 isoform X1 [Rhinatrema bivittatum]XP_029465851.1 uncharacterized protein LOC115095801 isoform X1 [Rhinatrema bivittatum]XP_029465857.1 uncharacterized protein LOC115095801 isoform X1 [Rhinatrema bivittatum]XP_029465867.1 uncharacterized protein LOC115095801 isoform X1 [Rhinatrema bivittatum]XP_029465876.1 uncharacterized protein LOC115095801 isoform X1 [Rhinatrema bivittatum]XP_029465886.1 uncharacterized protein LOC115095801 isoform X1 [Rhinatrema bivit
MDLHPEQEFNQNSTSSIMSANPAIHYDFSGEVPSHNLEEQDKKPIIYVKQRDHIQMKHGGLFAKEEEACIEFDKMPDKEMQEVCLTGTSNLAPEETTFCQGSDVGKTTPEQHLAKTCDSERSFHQDRDEEQQESSEREGSLNIESNRQLWLSDLLQQELQFRGASSSHELEEYPVEEEYDSEVSKEESDDSHLQTYSPTKCSDDQDSKDDSDEEMQRHDVTDKLDPEVLHLLEMHLLKQQLVVIKEEQEEEPGFDDLHINEQKEHFEAFVASKKIAPVLDIVLEEPEPVDENEQALDTSHEVDFKDVALLEQDPDGKSRFSEVEYHEMSWVDPVELSFKTRATDIAREGLDEVIQESLWQGQSTEQLLGKSIEEMKPCAEEFENMHKDAEDVEADEIIGDLDCHTRYRYKQHVMVDASEIIGN